MLETVANRRTHGTTGEPPILRFERDERALLLPLAERPYRSLVLLPRAERAQTKLPPRLPQVAVERRPLSAYATLALRRQLERDGLEDLIGELVEVNGPLDAKAVARYIDEWR